MAVVAAAYVAAVAAAQVRGTDVSDEANRGTDVKNARIAEE